MKLLKIKNLTIEQIAQIHHYYHDIKKIPCHQCPLYQQGMKCYIINYQKLESEIILDEEALEWKLPSEI